MSLSPSPPGPVAAPASVVGSWQVRLLGGLALDDGRQRLHRLPSRAHVALLACLALQPERAHAREALIERLWPGVALDVGRNRLRQVLSTLRNVLEPAGRPQVLEADRTHVRVLPGRLACDALQFEQALRAGRVDEALAWYRGELLPGYYDDWIDDERNRLAALHERWADAAAPGAAAAPAAAHAPPPAPPAFDMARASLPHYLTPLFGCEPWLATLREQVQATRLVSVLGPGGCGKTRLAVELAHRLGPPFDGVFFIPLVTCTQATQALEALASALQLNAPGPDPLPGLVSALAGRRVLLVLDNFEQLVDDAAALVGTLLARLPQLHVLVTSRRPLMLDGERQVAMPVLPLPAEQAGGDAAGLAANPAVGLFLDRARAVRQDFAADTRQIADTAALVRALEGLPLAIELAASRVRTLSPAQMLQRLQASGTPWLALLARSGPRAGADPRHASMQRVVEWSWQQLRAPMQRLLAELATLAAPFSADMAIELCQDLDADPALLLDELVAHSLLRVTGQVDGGDRFAPYEPVREFVLAQVASDDGHPGGRGAMRRARLRAWAQHWVDGQPPTPSLPALRAEWPHLVAAIDSAEVDGVPGEALQLLIGLQPVLDDTHLPARALASLMRAQAEATDPLLVARARRLLAWQLYVAGRAEEALAIADAALAAATTPGDRARALHASARVRWRTRRQAAEVEPLLDEADALEAAHPDPGLRASLLALRAFVVNSARGEFARGEALHAQALALWLRLGNQHSINSGRYNLAVCAQNADRHAQTLERLVPVLASARELQDTRRISQCLNVQGNGHSGLRQWAPAVAAYRECVQVAWAAMAPFDLAYGFWNLPRALAHLRQPHAAVRLMAFSVRFWEERFGALTAEDRRYIERVRRLVRCQIAPGAWAELWVEGEALAPAQALALVNAVL